MKQTKTKLAIFEGKRIRRHWNGKTEEWYFSVVDIVAVLTESTNPTDYLKKLRKRDPELGNYIGTNCPQVEMSSETGKKIVSASNYIDPGRNPHPGSLPEGTRNQKD